MITLYQRSDCPFCWKLRLALAELELSYKPVATQLGQRHPEVASLSATGSVPVLVDDDVVIWDSAVALEYLDSRYAPGRLFTSLPAVQAEIRLLHLYSDKVVGAALRELVFEKRSQNPDQWDTAKIAASEEAWRQCMAWLEGKMQSWENPTAADCALGARFGVAEAYGADFSADFPILRDWYEQLKQRPSWQQAYPDSFIRPQGA
jgi:glutathione S-transferase